MACESCASSHLKGPDVSKRVLGIYSTGPQVGEAYNKVHLRKELHSPPFRYICLQQLLEDEARLSRPLRLGLS